MGFIDKDGYERKQAWAERRMAKNLEIDTLTEEQHLALADLCRARHNFHSHSDDFWKGNSDYYNELENANLTLLEVNLPYIKGIISVEDIPYAEDYYYVLGDEEREKWENRAGELNKQAVESRKRPFMWLDGRWLWQEESGAYDEFWDCFDKINDAVEKYLAEIDKKYGTDYCPSGATRIF
jgi:hypothetical protein